MEATEAVPVYVLATDGRLYLNPSIKGSVTVAGRRIEWGLVFGPVESPQFVVEAVGVVGFDAAGRLAASILRAVGVSANIAGVNRQVRLLDERVEWCYVFDLEVLRPIPADKLAGFASVMQPSGEHVLYSFGRLWG